MRHMPFFALTIAAALTLSACGADETPPVSKGQQINDLQQAYKNRAITADEYKEQKEEVLDQ